MRRDQPAGDWIASWLADLDPGDSLAVDLRAGREAIVQPWMLPDHVGAPWGMHDTLVLWPSGDLTPWHPGDVPSRAWTGRGR